MLEQENDLSLASGFERGSKNKDLSEANSELDSGFLSGPQQIFSGELSSSGIDSTELKSKDNRHHSQQRTSQQTQQKTAPASETFVDLGIGDDLSSSQMISGGGETGGLSDWFNNLNIKDSPSINNLDAAKGKTVVNANPASQPTKSSIEANLWKLCYRQDNDGDTQLHLAIINEIPHIIWAIIRLAPAQWLLDLKNDDAQAPIHLAALTRQSNVVRRLLLSGAKASIRDGDGNTALHLACINEDLSTMEALLEPITIAEQKEHNQWANQLPQSNANNRKLPIDLDQRNFYGENCVHIAAQRNNTDILKKLVDAGADVNAREGRAGFTVLHMAVENENIELAEFIIKECKNLDTETLCYRQITAYQLACELDNFEMLRTLERLGCRVISVPDSDYEDSDDSADADSD